ncbi:MAG: hypothetical protein Q8N23_02145 [Archangium sp.]|nr:hypothetical protein [Archangium sp.]MDP3575333.1 hypothetical protein [Archangium sp.]
MTGTLKPDPELDYRMNSRGSMVIAVLRVKDVVTALRCSRSHAYQVIRECRGELIGSTLAFILPSQLRDWTLRQLGRPALPTRSAAIERPLTQSELGALKQAARNAQASNLPGSIKFTQPRTKAKKGGL